MRDVKIKFFDKNVMVELTHVEYFQKKEALVKKASQLQRSLENVGGADAVIADELRRTMRRIQRLNRTMNRGGMYCQIVD